MSIEAISNGPTEVALPRRSFAQVVYLVLYMRGDFARVNYTKFHTLNYGATSENHGRQTCVLFSCTFDRAD